MAMTPNDLLVSWLRKRLLPDQCTWLDDSLQAMQAGPKEALLYKCFNLVGRKLGKQDLLLSTEDLGDAAASCPGWDPSDWSIDQAGRLALLLHLPLTTAGQWTALLDDLCQAADVSELVTLYRGLPLYPFQDAHQPRATEGIRSNMKAVFEAVAHKNPYPATQLGEDAWNQMVLKALFVGSELAPIQQLDDRCNPQLTHMLTDYARERLAAKRPISPELWRCVAPFASDEAITLLHGQLKEPEPAVQKAAALALADTSAAPQLKEAAPALAAAIADHTLTWNNFKDEYDA